MSDTRDPATDQRLPVTSTDRPVIQTLVVEDIRTRLAHGIEKYGTGLQPHNGRDALQDLYEELLDAVMYIKQLMVERGDMPAAFRIARRGDHDEETYPEGEEYDTFEKADLRATFLWKNKPDGSTDCFYVQAWIAAAAQYMTVEV